MSVLCALTLKSHADEIAPGTVADIRECTNKSWVLGSERFKKEIATVVNRQVESKGWGGARDQGV